MDNKASSSALEPGPVRGTRPRPHLRSAVVAAGVALLALATLVVVALASTGHRDEPLESVTPTRLIPQLIVLAIVVMTLVGLTLWILLPTGPSNRSASRHRTTGPAWLRVVVAGVWLLLLILLAVLVQQLAPEPPDADRGAPNDDQEVVFEPNTPDAGGVDVITVGLGVAAIAGLALGATGFALFISRNRKSHPAGEPGNERPPSGRAERALVRRALVDAADGLDAHDDPRVAVIECYWRMERAMADAGIPPTATETATEFLDRCLSVVGAGADGARRLTALFEWAMFSDHPVDEAMRRDARDALRSVAAGLGETTGEAGVDLPPVVRP